jgi:hypothetical protein
VSDITLPRAVGLHIRNSLRGIVNASDDDCGEEKCRDCAPVRVMRAALAALDAALAEPEQKPDALRRDAERYRWLKSRAEDYDGHVCFGEVRYPAPIPDCTPFDAIDAAIDAAMQEDKT